jgi:hypothetical protein
VLDAQNRAALVVPLRVTSMMCRLALFRISYRCVAAFAALAVAGSLCGCGIIRERPESEPSNLDLIGKPMPPEKAKEVLSEVGKNFAHGPALGDTALNVGTAVVFPPYAIYLLGNAVLSLSGYEPVTVSSLLPEEDGKAWSETYDSLVSGPGKVVAAMSGHEYRSREVGDAKMREVLAGLNESDSQQPATQDADPQGQSPTVKQVQ